MTAMATVCPSPTAAADRGHSLTTGDQSIKIGELIRVGVDPALSRQDAVRPDHRDQCQGDVLGGRSPPRTRRIPRPRPGYDDEGMFDCAVPGRVHYASRDGQLRVAVEPPRCGPVCRQDVQRRDRAPLYGNLRCR